MLPAQYSEPGMALLHSRFPQTEAFSFRLNICTFDRDHAVVGLIVGRPACIWMGRRFRIWNPAHHRLGVDP